jgi:hypothetical protein
MPKCNAGAGREADHREERDVASDLDTAYVNLNNGTAAVGIGERNTLVRRGGHQGPLDSPAPGRIAMRYPKLGWQQHITATAIDFPERGEAEIVSARKEEEGKKMEKGEEMPGGGLKSMVARGDSEWNTHRLEAPWSGRVS